tara:strand:+ start:2404 stop:2712 length:309 start_codon:yes stop_codon:yes gene_type:complete
MAFKLKRHRRANNKSNLLKRLRILKAKKSLTKQEEAEMDRILIALGKKRTNKIESKKLNNEKQNEVAVSIYNGDNNLSDLNIGHLQSASGQYRRGRIDNRKK